VWADWRLILIGVVMLGMAFAEGSANDWLALGVVDGHHQSNATGALVFGFFVAAMTVGRVLGGPLVDRIGRTNSIRLTAGLGVLGLLLFILGGPLWLVVVGTVLWGFGVSLGFPLGMSAAADGTDKPAARVSAVAMIGYCAFLVGPPLIGFLGQAFGILNALFVLLVLMVASALAAPAVREASRTRQPRVSADA
jgi:MFS family permease